MAKVGEGPAAALRRLWHRLYYRCACMGWRAALAAGGVRCRVEGGERLPGDGAYLLVCNHISHFDPPTIAALLPRKHAWVVALDMYAHPLGAWFFRGIESIAVDRQGADREAVRQILGRLRRGEPVGLFPEAGIRSGTASVLGGQPLDDSVGGLAHVGRVPILPAVILGTDKLYCLGAWRWNTTVRVRIGATIFPGGDRRALTREVEVAMRSLAEDLRREHGLSEGDMPMTAQERWRIEREARRVSRGRG